MDPTALIVAIAVLAFLLIAGGMNVAPSTAVAQLRGKGRAIAAGARKQAVKPNDDPNDDCEPQDDPEEPEEEAKKATKKKGGAKPKADEACDDEDDEPQAGVLNERQRMAALKTEFPKNLGFAMEAFEQGWSVEKAWAMYGQRVASGKIKPDAGAGAGGSGNKPLQVAGSVPRRNGSDDEAGGYTSESGDPVADFSAAVRDQMKLAKCDRASAVKTVAKRDPALHEAYLLANNPGRRQQDLIRDRFQNA